MPDQGRPVEFGGNIDPTADNPTGPAQMARAIEAAGLEFAGIQDHPYNARHLDTWTLLATLTQITHRLRFTPNVANLPLRPPAMLAKAAATLDLLSGGRVALGLGAGALWDPIVAMGGPRRAPGDAVSALEEAIQVIRLMWSGQRGVRFDGQFYTLRGLHAGPPPAHAIEIWLGALGPRMLRLTGRLGDGWIPSSSYVKPDQLPDMQARIDEAAEGAGRTPQAIRRCYNVMGRIVPQRGTDYLDGPVDYWVEELTRLVIEVGMDTFLYWPSEDRLRQMEVFGAEVAPAVREAVARERGTSA